MNLVIFTNKFMDDFEVHFYQYLGILNRGQRLLFKEIYQQMNHQ